MELDLLRVDAETIGAQPASLQRGAVEAEAAEQQRTILRDLLPDNAPEHWVTIGSAVLFEEYERKVREIGTRLNPEDVRCGADGELPALGSWPAFMLSCSQRQRGVAR